MKYYKELNADGNPVAVCEMPDELPFPVGVKEIERQEYLNILTQFSNADAERAAKEKADAEAKAKAEEDKRKADEAAEEAKAKAEQEAAEKEWQERQDKINDYVSKVKAGEVKIEDVPDEYRSDVNYIVNPPVTTEELDKRLEAAESAVDFLMTTIAETSAQ